MTKMIESAKGISDIGIVYFEQDYFCVQVIDNSHISLAVLRLNKKHFSKYEYTPEKKTTININVIYRILKIIQPYDTISMKHVDGDRILTLIIENEEKGRQICYNLKTVDNTSNVIKLEKISRGYYSKVLISITEFRYMLNHLLSMNETAVLSIDKNYLKLTSKTVGKDEDSTTLYLKIVSKEILKSTDFIITFSVKYLMSFVKTIASSDSVTLWLGVSVPLRIEFSSIEDVSFVYFLAPKKE